MAPADLRRDLLWTQLSHRLGCYQGGPRQSAGFPRPRFLSLRRIAGAGPGLNSDLDHGLHRTSPLRQYGIPSARQAFGRDFWVGTLWGITSTSTIIGLIIAFAGYRVHGLAIHGATLWYFTFLWLIANLLIGF